MTPTAEWARVKNTAGRCACGGRKSKPYPPGVEAPAECLCGIPEPHSHCPRCGHLLRKGTAGEGLVVATIPLSALASLS